MDRPQLISLPLIESACAHVRVLSLDFELPTTVQFRTGLDLIKQARTNALTSSVREDPNVPKDCEITSPFKHRQPRCIEGDGRPTDDAGRATCHEERPVREIETTGPLQRPFASDRIVVLLIRSFEAAL